MGRSSIRIGQLISTFGPGSLMVDRFGTSLIICGLDWWYYREPEVDGSRFEADKKEEFRFNEWRLEQRLDMSYFMRPPDFRLPQRRSGGTNEQVPNLMLHIPTLRFPSYFVCSQASCNAMRQVEYELGNRPRCQEHQTYGRMNQVRFITICPRGHIDDFPWRRLLGCFRGDDCTGKLKLKEQGSSDLASITVECSCGRRENLGNVTSFEQMQDGTIISQLSEKIRENTGSEIGSKCRGRCLWHGADHFEACGEDIVATFPNATNVYHAKTWTSIFIPVRQAASVEIENITRFLDSSTDNQTILKTMWSLDQKQQAIAWLRTLIDQNAELFGDVNQAKSDAGSALEQFFSGVPILQDDSLQPSQPESEETVFRRVEFNVLRQDATERDLRTRNVEVTSDLTPYISKVVQVERLRETRILYGFDRFRSSPVTGSASEIGERALRQLFRKPPVGRGSKWLPGTVVFGEGIFFELSEEEVISWQQRSSKWLNRRLIGDQNYAQRMPWPEIPLAPVQEVTIDWVSRFLLVHSLAHIVINQLIFECGYSTASLRERLYVSADPDAPQAAILVYTSAGDSEGTLGGLVRLAEPERFSGVIQRACQRASWCSADPVCSEVSNSDDYNLAACHSCVLLPETSCEIFNKALDRSMVVGTPREPDDGFFSPLLTTVDRVTLG